MDHMWGEVQYMGIMFGQIRSWWVRLGEIGRCLVELVDVVFD